MNLTIGDKVVYPNQGVCELKEICDRNIAGRTESFYILRILFNGSTVMIPVSNVTNVGLRRLSDEHDLEGLFEILGSDAYRPDPDWKNRYKDNVEKMKTGSIIEVGHVLQNLHFLSFQKPLSFREKKMYDRARQLIVSEIATVRSEAIPEAEASLDQILSSAYERYAAAQTA